MKINPSNAAKLACIYAGLVFGIFWIPLRALAEAGFPGIWASVVFNAVAFIFVFPWFCYRWRFLVSAKRHFHVAAFVIAVAFILYTAAFLYTEVVRAILLFYLMPVWGFLLARFFIGEKITPVRWFSMVLGLIGLLVIIGVDGGFPLPRNIGDWMALLSGLFWAAGSLLLLTDQHHKPLDSTVMFLFWSMFGALLVALMLSFYGIATVPDKAGLSDVLIWLIPFTLLVTIPAGFAVIYGPTQLNPGIVGLLFMTEVSVAAISAALFANEPFGIRELSGVILISLAGLAEPLSSLRRPGKRASL